MMANTRELTVARRLGIVGVAVVLLCAALVGCGKTQTGIVGTWVNNRNGVELSLFSDGTASGCDPVLPRGCVYYEARENGTLVFLDEYQDPGPTLSYKVDGNKLYIVEGDDPKAIKEAVDAGVYWQRVK